MERVPVAVGDVIAGRYKLERVVGQGGMGMVFAAIDRELERRVAIKLLLPERVESEETVQRFLREAKAAARIRSEHVTQVYDTGRLEDGLPFIVMELLSGRDLGERIEADGPVPLGDVARCMLQACEALAQAHAAGIVHRDLKPANFFLARHADGSDVLKVLDFGISKIVSGAALTKSATVIGSPYYMSPEQLQSPTDVDHRTDIWALGVIAYEMLSGKRPFESETLPALCVAILHSEPRPIADHRPELPQAIARVIDRCLTKDRTKRVQNVGELANAFAPFDADSGRAIAQRVIRILETDPVQNDSLNLSEKSSERTANWAHTHRQREKKRVGTVAAMGVLLVGAVGTALYIVRESAVKPAYDGAAALSSQAPRSAAAPITAEPFPELGPASVRKDALSAPSASAQLPLSAAPSASAQPAPATSATVQAAAAPPLRREMLKPANPAGTKPPAQPALDPFLRRH